MNECEMMAKSMSVLEATVRQIKADKMRAEAEKEALSHYLTSKDIVVDHDTYRDFINRSN